MPSGWRILFRARPGRSRCELGLTDYDGGARAIGERVGCHVEDEGAVLPRGFDEEPLVLFVISQVAGELPPACGEAFLGRVEVVLPNHGDGVRTAPQAVGVDVEDEHPVVPAIGNEEPLVYAIHRHLRGARLGGVDAGPSREAK